VDEQDPTAPQDPNAPTRHTLPSGRVVEVRSPRTLIGEDIAAAIASQTAPGARGVVDMYNALIAGMVTQIEPGNGNAPALDGTVAAVLAQRGDDWRRLYKLVWEHYKMVSGESVIPDFADVADPTPPTPDSSGPRSGSEAPAPS
jgi:hypothetical protein